MPPDLLKCAIEHAGSTSPNRPLVLQNGMKSVYCGEARKRRRLVRTAATRPDGERAFRLLDPIRRFAAARLDNPVQAISGLESHLLDVLEAASARHGSQDRDMRRLDGEQLNLQAVLGWMARHGRPAGSLLRAIGNVGVWIRRSFRRTSELWLRIESLPQDSLRTDSDRLARSWLSANRLINDGRFSKAVALIDEILPDARRLEQPSRIALMLMSRPGAPLHGARPGPR